MGEEGINTNNTWDTYTNTHSLYQHEKLIKSQYDPLKPQLSEYPSTPKLEPILHPTPSYPPSHKPDSLKCHEVPPSSHTSHLTPSTPLPHPTPNTQIPHPTP